MTSAHVSEQQQTSPRAGRRAGGGTPPDSRRGALRPPVALARRCSQVIRVPPTSRRRSADRSPRSTCIAAWSQVCGRDERDARRRAALALGGVVEQPLERAGERVGVERHELDRPVGAEHRARARALQVDAREAAREHLLRDQRVVRQRQAHADRRLRVHPRELLRASRRRCARTGTGSAAARGRRTCTIRTSGRRACSSASAMHAERHGASRRHRAAVEDDRVVAPLDRPRVVDVMVDAVLERRRPRRRSARRRDRAATGSRRSRRGPGGRSPPPRSTPPRWGRTRARGR